EGQAKAKTAGYAMVVLLVAMSVMAVLLTAAMPVWKQMNQREKETELVFRGEQYARAIGLFQRKFANASPPNVDALVDGKYLRKKYKDPITNDDFLPLLAGQATAAGAPGAGGAAGQRPQAQAPVGAPTGTTGGVIGVVSKSKDTSIRIYKGRTHYNEW